MLLSSFLAVVPHHVDVATGAEMCYLAHSVVSPGAPFGVCLREQHCLTPVGVFGEPTHLRDNGGNLGSHDAQAAFGAGDPFGVNGSHECWGPGERT